MLYSTSEKESELVRIAQQATDARTEAEIVTALVPALAAVLGGGQVEVRQPDAEGGADADLTIPLSWGGVIRRVAAAYGAPAPDADTASHARALAAVAAAGFARLDAESRLAAAAARDLALARAVKALNVAGGLDAALATLVREAATAVGAGTAVLHLGDGVRGGIAVGCHALPVEWTGARVEPGDGAAGLALATGQPAVSGEGVPPRLPGARSAVAVPLLDGGDVRGALTVGFGTAHDLDDGALRALEALADLAVVACRNHEAYERLQTAASTDPLTGLLNHGAMQSRLREEIARARRDRQPLACVIIDLDDFKGVNDRHGHLAGDELLRAVAGALNDTLRPYDQVARYGGDEFVLVLPGTAEMEARTIAERARDAICARALPGRTGATAGCSIGVAAWKEPMTSDDLLAQSDGALLLAKRTGKGRVAVADADVERELALAAAGDGSPAAVQALAAAIEARDAYTRDHSEDVVRLATGVALMYGLDAEAVERISHAALIHDVGKLAVPGELLHREGPLTPEEWRLVAEHPVMGERILRRAPALAPLAPLVRHEHEHWDGSGYPDGLRGTKIPLGSRIVLACDAYCAMVAPRPYRPALSEREAIAELRRRAGTQFDPQVVTALLDVLGVESSL